MSNRTDRPRTDSKRLYAIAAVVIGFFILALLAMLLTGYFSGGQPRTLPDEAGRTGPVAAGAGVAGTGAVAAA